LLNKKTDSAQHYRFFAQLAATTVVIATTRTAAVVAGGETIVSATANEQKNDYKNPGTVITRETTHLC
jgi:hypothetical protein